MRIHHLWCVAVLIAVVACAQGNPPVQPGLEFENLLPETSLLKGWSIAEGPTSFSPDTLWEYLDGGAPRYLAYGLVRMVHVRYQLGDDRLSSISVEIYDMGSELGAFGIYSSIRPPDAVFQSWGAEGYRSGNVAAAWKGSVFVHVAADDDRSELIDSMEELVSRICGKLTGETSPLPILDPLPMEHLVPYSERFVASDLLGHADFGGGVLATYEVNGRSAELFFSELENEAVAVAAMATYRREKERWAKVADRQNGFRFVSTGPAYGIVVTSGRYVAGVQGDLPSEAQEDLLERLLERLDN